MMSPKPIVAMCAAILLVPAMAGALVIGDPGAGVELTDGNAKAVVDPNSQAGMYSWQVDGVEHMAQQWFWYRVGDDYERPIDTLTLDGVDRISPGYVVFTYSHDLFTLEIKYLLTGGEPGDGQSGIGEMIRIENVSDELLDLHFFQYCDLDLTGTAGDDTVQITGDTALNTATQTDASASFSETAAVWVPGKVEVSAAGATLSHLNDDQPSELNGVVGPIGPDDVAWAFQWDFAIAEGSARTFSKNKSVIPEPASLCLLALGSLLVVARRRRRG